MKRLILIGAALLLTSGALVMANGAAANEECCTPCEKSVCAPSDNCPLSAECCRK